MKVRLVLLPVLLPICFAMACRTSQPARPEMRVDVSAQRATVDRLLESPAVRAAFAHVESQRAPILDEWRQLTEIPAPSRGEAARAAEVEKLLRDIGSLVVERDSVGNVIATRKGTEGNGRIVVIDAHLDTVFPAATPVTTTMRDGRLFAPGVGDNTRNVEAMIAIARALEHANARTRKDLVFLFTVEEEDGFTGIDRFLEDRGASVDAFVALDGGYSGFTYGGVGTNWYKHHMIGPGGHTRSRTPPYSASLPLARAISRIYQLPVPSTPPSNLNIGMMGGASVINAKADDAWISLDLRSTDDAVIADLEKRIALILEEEAAREGMKVRTEIVSKAPAAQIEGHRFSPMVKMTEAVHHAMGFENPPITPTASNHSSAALRKGIAAISTGVAPCDDAHAITESCEIEPIYRGIRKVLLLGVALAELAE